MKRYQAYKDSGVSWIGEIPVDWSIKKLKYYTTTNDEVLTENTAPNYEFRYVDIGSVTLQNGIEHYQGFSFEDAPSRARRIVRTGDVIVSTVRTYLKAVASIQDDKDVIASTGFAVIRPKEVDSRFLAYSLANHYFVETVSSRSVGVSYPAINASEMVDIKNVLPPNAVQKCIADYLDRKTAAVDTAISDKEKLIQLLEEQRTSIICSAVTKGIDATTKMKDSGVEWLGEIPAHWQVVPAKALFSQSKETRQDDDIQLTASQKYGIISQEDYMALQSTKIVLADKGLDDWKHVEPNDFIISLRSFQGGLEISYVPGCITWHYIVLKPKDGVEPEYFKWLFKSPRYIQALQRTANFIRDGQDLRFSNFVQVPLPLIPKDEQKKIAEYLNRKTARIDSIISDVTEQIEKLKEYRQSVISEVVTGKVAVI
ncbi:restriction endonuclease subunit S [Lawsonibacter sp.]|uniref:restriction endonuclease subunit S n=1 Tax=Lawsonibacter sp. TaxID=2185275 RepID=UPI00258DB5E1|nr:restriction endonuclease subunit S [Lawsonibacter sp.]MCI6398739.1 restriction endonuclease subunit S [Lawsonibacter sp.]